jgi:anti-sigma factor RsiW
MSDERLHSYFDGELPPEERARLEAELASDPALADRLRELRELDLALDALPGTGVSPEFTSRVVRAARRRRSVIVRLVPLMAAAAAAAVALAILLPRSEAPTGKGSGTGTATAAAYTWEQDHETYGSLAVTDMEDQILEELEGT